MKTKTLLTLFFSLWVTAATAFAGTNEITALLQKGLFEEEANRNLDAAIQAYQSVITQTDKEHQLAATAIFRLAECYRKQGKTNEANVQYQRILHEFADQADLAKLSRQLLGAEAANGTPPLSYNWIFNGGPTGSNYGAQIESQDQSNTLSAREAAVKEALDDYDHEIINFHGSPEEVRVHVQQKYPNPVLNNLMEELTKEERTSVLLSSKFGPNNPEVVAQLEVVKSLQKQIDAQVKGVFDDLLDQKAKAQKIYDALHSQTNTAVVPQPTFPPPSVQIEEASENEAIEKIKTLIKDSPDLINARRDQNSETPLTEAVRSGHAKVVKFLLENHADPDVRGLWGLTALHLAADEGDGEILTLLLDHGADINAASPTSVGAADTFSFTALHFAARRGYKNIAEILLAHGAKINVQDASGKTPLFVASEKGFKTIAELLLAHGADVALPDNRGTTPFYAATKAGNLTIAKLLLANHADINTPAKYGSTPFLEAITVGNKAVFEFLLAEKATVNPPPDGGTTPLLEAAANGRLDFARALLEHGADLNARSSSALFHWTAVHYAVNRNDNPLLELLLDHQANPNIAVDFTPADNLSVAIPGITPLMMAAILDHKESAEILLTHRAEVEARDEDGRTALHFAVMYRHAGLVELLLAHNADVNARNKNGNSPLHLAALANSTPIAEVLLADNADVNARNNGGFSSLDTAAAGGYRSFPELLLAHHANVNIKNDQGNTPLDLRLQILTSQNGNVTSPAFDSDNIVVLLRQHGGFTEMERGTIRITGRGQATPSVVFHRDANAQNHFTLFETIGNAYMPGYGSSTPPEVQFPDFSRVKIRRLQTDGATNVLNVDLNAAFNSGDCSKDLPMQWGDVVEIPRVDHKLTEQWSGLSDVAKKTLAQCTARRVKVIIKGQTTEVTISPGQSGFSSFILSTAPDKPLVNGNTYWSPFSFWLHALIQDALIQDANLILASSDLTRIKVTRLDPATHKITELTYSSEKPSHANDLWLREGDTIEIPEKP